MQKETIYVKEDGEYYTAKCLTSKRGAYQKVVRADSTEVGKRACVKSCVAEINMDLGRTSIENGWQEEYPIVYE